VTRLKIFRYRMHPAVWAVIFFINRPVTAQDASIDLTAAQQCEGKMDWTCACDIYHSLVLRFPENDGFFRHYLDLCQKTGRFEQALDQLDQRCRRHPEDVNFPILMAQMSFRAGKTKEADRIWNALIEKNSNQEGIVLFVANSMAEERLKDQAAGVLLEARKRMRKPKAFSLDLALLYETAFDYAKAVREWILFLADHPAQFNTAKSHLMQYPAGEQNAREIFEVFKRELAPGIPSSAVLNLLIGYAVHTGRYSEALKILIQSENRIPEKQRGDVLFQFAGEAFSRGAIIPALESFEAILRQNPRFSRMDAVLSGLAKCRENLGENGKALEHLEALVREYPKSALLPEALFRKGLLERDKLNMPFQASATFIRLVSEHPGADENNEARFELAGCYIRMNDLGRAETVLTDLVQGQKNAAGEGKIRIQAIVGLSELYFYSGKFEKASVLLDSLFRKRLIPDELQDRSANDGLSLYLLLKMNAQERREPLLLLSKAELLNRQRKYVEAAELLDRIVAARPRNDAIAAEALYRHGLNSLESAQYRESAARLDTLLARYPGSVHSESALERSAWAKEKCGMAAEALESYERLIERFPRSVYADAARKRIRSIRKENP
jgi:tetratricopeptide (TPR) repeat protein